MQKTNEKVEQLNIYLARRSDLLNVLRKKEDLSSISHIDDKNFVKEFADILKECRVCNKKIKNLKAELDPRCYLKVEETEDEQKSLVVKKDNIIIEWIKLRIEKIKYSYNIERALKRDKFLEDNIDEQIDTFNAYLNVIKKNGNRATFTKHLKKVVQINTKENNAEKVLENNK